MDDPGIQELRLRVRAFPDLMIIRGLVIVIALLSGGDFGVLPLSKLLTACEAIATFVDNSIHRDSPPE